MLGRWLALRGLRWAAAYASPLERARDTAAILAAQTGFPAATAEPDLVEVQAGRLEGLTREEIASRHPEFLERRITELGDFAAYGGESHDEVQGRAVRVLDALIARHRAGADRVLLVAHGGFNFHLVKAAICWPVPRLCLATFGNCTLALLRFRERRNEYLADLAWHLPLELTGGEPGEGSTGVFR